MPNPDPLKLYLPFDLPQDGLVEEEMLLAFGRIPQDVIRLCQTFQNFSCAALNAEVRYTSLEECDFILFPGKASPKLLVENGTGKQVLLFYNSDDDTPFLNSESIIFRTSLYRSKKPRNCYALPAFCNDLRPKAPLLPSVRTKGKKPVVGFCGFIGHPVRLAALEAIDSRVVTNYLIRSDFWGGDPWNRRLRQEYIDNTLSSDFVLCARGGGNFSYRFYETLCLGRTPILIDSDIDVPFHEFIDFGRLFPIVADTELHRINERVLEFWAGIGDYAAHQQRMRQLWEDHFSPMGFVRTLNRFKREIAANQH